MLLAVKGSNTWRGHLSRCWLPVVMGKRKPVDAAATEEAQAAQDKPQSKPKAKKPKKLLEPSVDPTDAGLLAKASKIASQLNTLYPDPAIPLNHSSHFQLLVAVALSAQTTDVKVNEVTPELFTKYPDAHAMSKAEVSDVAHIIRFLGLGPTKAKNVVGLSKMLVEEHGGEVPDSWEALEALPGVGHKTASVVMAQAFGRDAFPVDTHIHRLAQRWGLTVGSSVEQTEADLKALLPAPTWRNAHLQIIYFGREHCPAVGHDPTGCAICSWAAVPPYHKAGASPARPGQKPPKTNLPKPIKIHPALADSPNDAKKGKGRKHASSADEPVSSADDEPKMPRRRTRKSSS